MLKVKRLIVNALLELCDVVDRLFLKALKVRGAKRLVERVGWSCRPAALSTLLDERWKTGVWKEGPDLERIALMCGRECERQQVGLDRVAMLIDGYRFTLENQARLPTEDDALLLVAKAEPSSRGAYRTTPVTFANGTQGATASTVPGATARLFELLDDDTDADEFCKSFLKVHPFSDGNGRVAFVLRNWLSGQLSYPIALPDYEF